MTVNTASHRPAAALTGLDLRLRRTAALVTQTDLARELGVPRQSISYLESKLRPSAAYVERYLAALDRLSAR